MSCVEVWYYYWVVGWFGRVRLRVAENAAIANAVWRNWVWREQDAPEVHRLGADGRVPEPGEAGGLSACGRRMAAGVVLAEVCAEGAEDAGAGAERHGGLTVGGVGDSRRGESCGCRR
jgi:hypothetical protein